MKTYADILNTRVTPQSEPIPGQEDVQVKNRAGGYVYKVDDWTRAERFLITGSDEGSYYAGPRKLTTMMFKAVRACMKADGKRLVDLIVDISTKGRAPKQDAAIIALAMVLKEGDEPTRRAAAAAVSQVCRTGTTLFQFAEAIKGFGGFGTLTMKALASYYTESDLDKLTYHAIKYRQRDGWTHRDVLRKAHPRSDDPQRKAIFDWICGRHPETLPPQIVAFEGLQKTKVVPAAATLIRTFWLPWEAVPSAMLENPVIWEALLESMPPGAMLRNLPTLTRMGVIAPGTDGWRRVSSVLGDPERVVQARIHPMQAVMALRTYASGGRSYLSKSKHTWDAIPQVIDLLDGLFEASFGSIVPTGKSWVLAVDVSGSMQSGMQTGKFGMTPSEAAAVMAMIVARTERDYTIIGYTTRALDLAISAKQRLDDVCRAVKLGIGEGTDASQPILWANRNGIKADVVAQFTDGETWAGLIHPMQALRGYRDYIGRPVKMVTQCFEADKFTIGDPADGGTLDVAGFDRDAPNVITDFVR